MLVLSVGALAAVAVGAGCGSEGGRAPSGSVDVTFTRAGGSTAPFPATVQAWCAPYDEHSSHIEAVHVLAGDLPRGEQPASYWILRAVRADIVREPVTILPNAFVFSEPTGASFFAFDAPERGNEVSSSDEESTGTIRVDSAGCEDGDPVHVVFDGVVLGSELHLLPTLSVSGTVVAEIGEPPTS